jgi:hypothetical protein
MQALPLGQVFTIHMVNTVTHYHLRSVFNGAIITFN